MAMTFPEFEPRTLRAEARSFFESRCLRDSVVSSWFIRSLQEVIFISDHRENEFFSKVSAGSPEGHRDDVWLSKESLMQEVK